MNVLRHRGFIDFPDRSDILIVTTEFSDRQLIDGGVVYRNESVTMESMSQSEEWQSLISALIATATQR